MRKFIILPLLVLPLLLSLSCLETMKLTIPQPRNGGGLDERTIIAGLKEALNIGTKNAVNIVSRTGGYFKNPRISIPLPDELKKVGDTLRKIGLKKKVDEFVHTMNTAAEKAAPQAVDIFVDAISRMTVQDAVGILHGGNDAATAYFERKTRDRLYGIFFPIVRRVLSDVGVTGLYKFLIDAYNGIPGTPKVRFDLDAYATNKGLDGLFTMIADEEKNIRKNPAARITELLRKVFG